MKEEQVIEVVSGLLEIAYHAMPETFWFSDSRIAAARDLLGTNFPSVQYLEERFEERAWRNR